VIDDVRLRRWIEIPIWVGQMPGWESHQQWRPGAIQAEQVVVIPIAKVGEREWRDN
jgi:hypothetical protein